MQKAMNEKVESRLYVRERMPLAVSILHASVFEVPSGADRVNN